MRATVAERNTEARGVAEGHVGTPLAGRLEEGQGQKVRRAHDVAAEVVSPLGDGFPVGNFSSDVGILRGARGMPHQPCSDERKGYASLT